MQHWSSQFGFLMATLGAAVGLGNLWKFPYVVGKSGGAAFILLFVIFSLIMGLPLMLAEFVIGGLGRSNAVMSLRRLSERFHRAPSWKYLGLVGTVNLLVIMSFYSVIAGWAVVYLGHALMGLFEGISPEQSTALMQGLMRSPRQMLIGHTLFTLMTGWVVLAGVRQGIERCSKIMMPALFGIIVAVVLYNTTLSGFGEAVQFLFEPDITKLNAGVVLDALGQALFSLAAGSGCLCLYAAYQADSSSITRQSLFILSANIIIAVLAGLAIFPIVFSHGIDPASGEGLIFESLPLALGHIPYGYLLGILLFVLFIFAALTSSVSLVEPPVATLEQSSIMGRKASIFLAVLVAWALGALYIVLMGSSCDIFGSVIYVSSNCVLPLTGIGFVVFAGYQIPFQQVAQYLDLGPASTRILQIGFRYLTPLGLLLILGWQLFA